MVERPLRRDAERNRRHLLSTARTLMADHGLSVTHEQIARAAGMGMGTVYRRFPAREDLIDALFAEHVDAVVRIADEACERARTHGDAWAALTSFMTRQFELEAESRALGELLRQGAQAPHLVRRARAEITPRVVAMVDQAVRDGQLPRTTSSEDFALVHLMVGAVMDATRGLDDGSLWRRALATSLAGIRRADHRDPVPDDNPVNHWYGVPPAEESDDPTAT